MKDHHCEMWNGKYCVKCGSHFTVEMRRLRFEIDALKHRIEYLKGCREDDQEEIAKFRAQLEDDGNA